MHCPAGNVTDSIWRVLASSQGISSWTPLKPQLSIPCWLSVQWEPSAYRSCQCCQKRGHQKFVGGFSLSGLLGCGRASMLPLGTLSLGLWPIVVDPPFIADHQSIKSCGSWIDKLDHLSAAMTTSFFLVFSEHSWDKPHANLLHLQFLTNNCVQFPRWHQTVHLSSLLTHDGLYLASQLWCSDTLTPPTPLIIPHRLPAFLESLMPLKNWCSIHIRCSKSSLKYFIRFCGIYFQV